MAVNVLRWVGTVLQSLETPAVTTLFKYFYQYLIIFLFHDSVMFLYSKLL